MGTRARRDRLEVHRDLPPAVVAVPGAPGVPGPPDPTDPTDPTGATDATGPTDEPEFYGVRSSWQSEAVRIEAAEFLVATRVQEDSRRRLARLVARLREQARTDR